MISTQNHHKHNKSQHFKDASHTNSSDWKKKKFTMNMSVDDLKRKYNELGYKQPISISKPFITKPILS